MVDKFPTGNYQWLIHERKLETLHATIARRITTLGWDWEVEYVISAGCYQATVTRGDGYAAVETGLFEATALENAYNTLVQEITL